MDWAKRRQRLVEIILTLVGIALIAVVVIAVTYKAPSCMDGRQDQGETGIDCGGPCPYLCSVDEIAPHVSFVRAISPQAGRTDIIAYIDNSNPNGEVQAAKYTVDLYGANQQLILSRTGTVDLPAASTIPLFLPSFYRGGQQVKTAFLSFDPSSLTYLKNSAHPVFPTPSDIQIQDGPMPKITAMLTNPLAQTLYNETVVATVFDGSNNAIAASQTVVPTFTGQAASPIVFTWNQEFTGKPVRVEILPAPPANP